METSTPTAESAAPSSSRWHYAGQLLPILGLLVLLLIVWEGVKLVGGNPLRINTVVGETPIVTEWNPPFRFRFASDLNMPHLWDIAGSFFRPATRNGALLIQPLLASAGFTAQVALIGFALGSSLGFGFAVLVFHVRLLRRFLVPVLVASQTVPILVIAPMIVIWLRAGWFSIALIAAYLSFFPVTLSTLRGFESVAIESVELMHSYGATRAQMLRKLLVPASLPYLFVGLKLAATASVLGTIIGELPSGISTGLGAIILNFAQYYTTDPSKLWACLIVAALLGVTVYGLVQLAETLTLRNSRSKAVLEPGMRA